MKKLLLILMLLPAIAFGSGLDGKIYSVILNETEFQLAFQTDTVTATSADFEAVFTYYYVEPLGSFESIPFYVWQDWIVFVTGSIVGTDITPAPSPTPTPEPVPDDPIDLSKVEWLHTDVSSWEVTAKLNAIKIKETTIEVDYDKACEWPGQSINDGPECNANPWIFVELDGQWYAATWEWLKTCQTVKNLYAVDGSHIKVPPLDSWHPVSGETYYFMVSGLARQTQRNVKERSNLLKVVWP